MDLQDVFISQTKKHIKTGHLMNPLVTSCLVLFLYKSNSAKKTQSKQKTYQEKDPSNFKKYIDEKVDLTDYKHKTEI